ncbi:MAG: hypothetical protein R2708_24465 [Vicinamibacterales bacterium]
MTSGAVGLVLVAHAAATWAMTGLIWFVQVVHYPLMAAVGGAGFAAYHAAHARLTTLVVGPLMLAEAACAVWIAAARPTTAAWIGLALVAAVWSVTFVVSVPRHNLLAAGYDVAVIDSLVATNWIRTMAWTARAVVAAWLLWPLTRVP